MDVCSCVWFFLCFACRRITVIIFDISHSLTIVPPFSSFSPPFYFSPLSSDCQYDCQADRGDEGLFQGSRRLPGPIQHRIVAGPAAPNESRFVLFYSSIYSIFALATAFFFYFLIARLLMFMSLCCTLLFVPLMSPVQKTKQRTRKAHRRIQGCWLSKQKCIYLY